jgi:hypothetical protein
MASGAAAHPFRHAMFQLMTRNHFAALLAQQNGYSRSEAFDVARSLTDDIIEQTAEHVVVEAAKTGGAGAVPKMGAGGILAFLMAFLQSPLFSQLLQTLLSLFGGTAPGSGMLLPASTKP